MPTEHRDITFNSHEIIEALVDYDRHADQKFTCGVIGSVNVNGDPDVSIAVDLKVHGQKRNLNLDVGTNYAGAALVMFCVKNKIPIPRDAIRYLKKTGENVVLCFSMNEDIEAPVASQLKCI